MGIKCLGLKQSKLKRVVFTNQGRIKTFSTIEKLAYNNAQKYTFNDETFDYTKKQVDDFLKADFILPKGVKTEKNKVELFEELEEGFKKNDAFLGMNYIISLPKELDFETNRKIILDFFQNQANSKQNFIDVCFHLKNEGKENENLHCHILEGRRTINQDGSVGNALRLKKSHLDDVKWIREQLAEAFNQALTAKNIPVKYTYKSNESLVNDALDSGNVPLAIEKSYQPDTKKTKGYDSKFYMNRKSFFVQQQREKTLKIKQQQKEKAEQYRKDLAELKELEAQLKELEQHKNYFELQKNNEIFEAMTKLELDEYLSNNKEKINNLRLNISAYEQDKKQTRELYKNLTYEFFKASQEKDFEDKREIKKLFKDYLTEREIKIDDEINYKINLLSYKIAKDPEKYIKQEQKKEEFKQFKEKSAEIKKEVENIKEQAQIEKDALNLTREVLAEYDDNINQVFKLMNSKYFVNVNQHNNFNNVIKYN